MMGYVNLYEDYKENFADQISLAEAFDQFCCVGIFCRTDPGSCSGQFDSHTDSDSCTLSGNQEVSKGMEKRRMVFLI